MGAKLNSADMNEKMDDGSDDKLVFLDFKTTYLKAPISADSVMAGYLTEGPSFSEQISTEDTELSSTDVSVKANETTEIPVQSSFHYKPDGGVTRAVSICSSSSVEKEQPKPLCALLPSSMEVCTVYESNQSLTPISRGQESLKSTTVHTEPDKDLCAAILLACLFCHPLDCLLATTRGCNECIWSLCGCELNILQSLLDITHHCDFCGCLGVRCFACDCSICNICIQTTECLDLAMEISQMLFH